MARPDTRIAETVTPLSDRPQGSARSPRRSLEGRGASYGSVSSVFMMRYFFPLGEVNAFSDKIEVSSGMPGRPLLSSADSVESLFVCDARSFSSGQDTVDVPHGSNSMSVTGWSSQMVGISGRRMAGPGLEPELWLLSKNSDPSTSTGIGGS